MTTIEEYLRTVTEPDREYVAEHIELPGSGFQVAFTPIAELIQ
ncbi:MAG: hypothetical protein ACLGPM_00105 [Acidobacteriota bacterium]